jgi:hypothetical protein
MISMLCMQFDVCILQVGDFVHEFAIMSCVCRLNNYIHASGHWAACLSVSPVENVDFAIANG